MSQLASRPRASGARDPLLRSSICSLGAADAPERPPCRPLNRRGVLGVRGCLGGCSDNDNEPGPPSSRVRRRPTPSRSQSTPPAPPWRLWPAPPLCVCGQPPGIHARHLLWRACGVGGRRHQACRCSPSSRLWSRRHQGPLRPHRAGARPHLGMRLNRAPCLPSRMSHCRRDQGQKALAHPLIVWTLRLPTTSSLSLSFWGWGMPPNSWRACQLAGMDE